MLPMGTSPDMIAGVSRSAVIVTSSGFRPYFVKMPSSFATQTGATPAVGVTTPNFIATGAGEATGWPLAALAADGGAAAGVGAAQPTASPASNVATRRRPA